MRYTKKQRALAIIDLLKIEYPDAACTLDYNEAWKLLVSVRLAAQCTDARVNVVVEGLYEKYPTVEALLVRADGNYPTGGKKEGIVIRPTEPVFSERISAALSMKVVSNKYLLKNEV